MEWRTVDGFPNYEVSNHGDVRNKKTRRVLRQCNNSAGYRMVDIYSGVQQKEHKLVHRLVADAFIVNESCKEQVNHIDGDKSNNKAINLEWATRSENIVHSLNLGMHKKGEKHHNAKLSDADVETIRMVFVKGDLMFGGRALARRYKVDLRTILRIVNGLARVG